MPQFYMLLYANYTILATQKGGGAWHHGPLLNTPLARPPNLEFNIAFPLANFFFKIILLPKNWRKEVNCYKKNGMISGTPTTRGIVLAVFTLLGAFNTLGIFATSSCQI